MTTLQKQFRRDTATNLNAATPAAGEPGFDTTNKRLVVGDGATAGGIKHASAADIQKKSFIYPTVGGTANAVTLTNTPPITSYTDVRQIVKLTSTVSAGAMTMNVDGLGTKDVKVIVNGSLSNPTANMMISGGVYIFDYDGTRFLLQNPSLVSTDAGGLVLLDTKTASGSASIDFTGKLSASHDNYLVKINNLTAASDGAFLWMRMSTNNGSSYDTGSVYGWSGNAAASSTTANFSGQGSNSVATTRIVIPNQNVGFDTSLGASGDIELFNVNSSTYKPVLSRMFIQQADTAADTYYHIGSGVYRNSSVVDAFQFLMSSGNIATGTFRLYGYKNS